MGGPEHDFPRCWPTSRLLGRLGLRLFGWRAVGDPPSGLRRAVVIAYPHTSNWDFFFALLAGWSFGLSFQWLGKDTLFQPPLGWLLRALGGVAVDRSAPQGLVAAAADQLRAADRMMLMIPAEGTRGYRPYWKSGFLHIARAAGVPIVLGYVDYARRHAGFGPAIPPSDDTVADMDAIRAFYADKVGKHPHDAGRIRLPIEDEPSAEG